MAYIFFKNKEVSVYLSLTSSNVDFFSPNWAPLCFVPVGRNLFLNKEAEAAPVQHRESLVKWSRTSHRECYFHCNQSLIDTFLSLSLSRATPFLKDFLCLSYLLDLSQLFKECNQQRAMSSNFVVHPVVLEFVEEESALEWYSQAMLKNTLMIF